MIRKMITTAAIEKEIELLMKMIMILRVIMIRKLVQVRELVNAAVIKYFLLLMITYGRSKSGKRELAQGHQSDNGISKEALTKGQVGALEIEVPA